MVTPANETEKVQGECPEPSVGGNMSQMGTGLGSGRRVQKAPEQMRTDREKRELFPVQSRVSNLTQFLYSTKRALTSVSMPLLPSQQFKVWELGLEHSKCSINTQHL